MFVYMPAIRCAIIQMIQIIGVSLALLDKKLNVELAHTCVSHIVYIPVLRCIFSNTNYIPKKHDILQPF